MPTNVATLTYLANLPLYEHEKPYIYLPRSDQDIDPDDPRLNNLHFESHDQIQIRDMREHPELDLSRCGFAYFEHKFTVQNLSSEDEYDQYILETQDVLRDYFSAAKVVTYEARLRRNVEFKRKKIDLNDKLLPEGPAHGAHNDATCDSGPAIIQRYLSQEDQDTFLRPGFRLRLVNTWRPLNHVLEDRPLALCDASTVEPDDLIASDRVLPGLVGEIYYLRHNSQQQWYWLEMQKTTEPFVFTVYDTEAQPSVARFCPHVSFENSRAGPDAERRFSVETRSIVINRVGDATL